MSFYKEKCERCGDEPFNKRLGLCLDCVHLIVEEVGFKPLEDYPGGSNLDWPLQCLTCERISNKRLSNLRQGKGCKGCRGHIGVEEMKQVMREKASLEPIVEYPGSSRNWKSQCLKCGGIISVNCSYSNVKIGISRGCPKCRPEPKPPTRPCKVEGCPNESFSPYGSPGKCEKCYLELFTNAGYIPLEPYNTSGRLRCECEACGKQYSVDTGNVMAGKRCRCLCRTGFDPSRPSVIYIVESECKTIRKFGISNHPDQRYKDHQRQGFTVVVDEMAFNTGWDAEFIERRILEKVRRVEAGPALKASSMKQGGWSETYWTEKAPSLSLKDYLSNSASTCWSFNYGKETSFDDRTF